MSLNTYKPLVTGHNRTDHYCQSQLKYTTKLQQNLIITKSGYLHQVRSVLVYERAKSQSAPEWSRHVGDGHISIALAMYSTPLLQSLDGGHIPARQRRWRLRTKCVEVSARRSRRKAGWKQSLGSGSDRELAALQLRPVSFFLPDWPPSLRDELVVRLSAHYSNWHRPLIRHSQELNKTQAER